MRPPEETYGWHDVSFDVMSETICRAEKQTTQKDEKLIVYFSHFPSGPHRVDYFQVWHGGNPCRHNQLRQVWFRCIQEFQTYGGGGESILAFPCKEKQVILATLLALPCIT
jgi:hypothetical protein